MGRRRQRTKLSIFFFIRVLVIHFSRLEIQPFAFHFFFGGLFRLIALHQHLGLRRNPPLHHHALLFGAQPEFGCPDGSVDERHIGPTQRQRNLGLGRLGLRHRLHLLDELVLLAQIGHANQNGRPRGVDRQELREGLHQPIQLLLPARGIVIFFNQHQVHNKPPQVAKVIAFDEDGTHRPRVFGHLKDHVIGKELLDHRGLHQEPIAP